MKLINSVTVTDYNKLQIKYEDKVFTIMNAKNADYKGIRHSFAAVSGAYKQYSEFSKSELLNIQYVLLNAYVFANDVLDKSIEDSESKTKLDNDKNVVLVIRKHLRYMTTYIDAYEELVNEYKGV